MQAAERIFDGAFDHISDDAEDIDMVSTSDRAGSSSLTRSAVSTRASTGHTVPLIRVQTPEADENEDEDSSGEVEDDDEGDEYSTFEHPLMAKPQRRPLL